MPQSTNLSYLFSGISWHQGKICVSEFAASTIIRANELSLREDSQIIDCDVNAVEMMKNLVCLMLSLCLPCFPLIRKWHLWTKEWGTIGIEVSMLTSQQSTTLIFISEASCSTPPTNLPWRPSKQWWSFGIYADVLVHDWLPHWLLPGTIHLPNLFFFLNWTIKVGWPGNDLF